MAASIYQKLQQRTSSFSQPEELDIRYISTYYETINKYNGL